MECSINLSNDKAEEKNVLGDFIVRNELNSMSAFQTILYNKIPVFLSPSSRKKPTLQRS